MTRVQASALGGSFWGACGKEHGEDAPPVNITAGNKTFLAVADGVGGSGGRVVNLGNLNRTEAYFGSNIALNAVKIIAENIAKRSEAIGASPAFIDNVLREQFLKVSQRVHAPTSELAVLPTTLCIAVCSSHDKFTDVAINWAGDSRAYFLSPKGISFLSLDDINPTHGDTIERKLAFATRDLNGKAESFPITNSISSELKFHLNSFSFRFFEPGIVFVCSDGITDIMSEATLLENLLALLETSPDFSVFMGQFMDGMEGVKADDYSFSACAINSDYSHVKESILAEKPTLLSSSFDISSALTYHIKNQVLLRETAANEVAASHTGVSLEPSTHEASAEPEDGIKTESLVEVESESQVQWKKNSANTIENPSILLFSTALLVVGVLLGMVGSKLFQNAPTLEVTPNTPHVPHEYMYPEHSRTGPELRFRE